MKSRFRSNKNFNSSRPYPGGFHAFKNEKTEKELELSGDNEKELSGITLPAGGIPWNSQTCSWTLPAPPSGVMEFTATQNANLTPLQPGSGSSGVHSATMSKRKYDLGCPM